jgi:hypothetical protein
VHDPDRLLPPFSVVLALGPDDFCEPPPWHATSTNSVQIAAIPDR